MNFGNSALVRYFGAARFGPLVIFSALAVGFFYDFVLRGRGLPNCRFLDITVSFGGACLFLCFCLLGELLVDGDDDA